MGHFKNEFRAEVLSGDRMIIRASQQYQEKKWPMSPRTVIHRIEEGETYEESTKKSFDPRKYTLAKSKPLTEDESSRRQRSKDG